MTAGLDPGAGDAAGAGEGSAEDFSGVPLLAMAADDAASVSVLSVAAWNVTTPVPQLA